MYFRQLLNDETACASYLLGCKSKRTFAVVDPHLDLVDDYIELAAAQGIPIAAVLETHVQADHVSGLPALVERTGATACLPGRGRAPAALRRSSRSRAARALGGEGKACARPIS